MKRTRKKKETRYFGVFWGRIVIIVGNWRLSILVITDCSTCKDFAGNIDCAY